MEAKKALNSLYVILADSFDDLDAGDLQVMQRIAKLAAKGIIKIEKERKPKSVIDNPLDIRKYFPSDYAKQDKRLMQKIATDKIASAKAKKIQAKAREKFEVEAQKTRKIQAETWEKNKAEAEKKEQQSKEVAKVTKTRRKRKK